MRHSAGVPDRPEFTPAQCIVEGERADRRRWCGTPCRWPRRRYGTTPCVIETAEAGSRGRRRRSQDASLVRRRMNEAPATTITAPASPRAVETSHDFGPDMFEKTSFGTNVRAMTPHTSPSSSAAIRLKTPSLSLLVSVDCPTPGRRWSDCSLASLDETWLLRIRELRLPFAMMRLVLVRHLVGDVLFEAVSATSGVGLSSSLTDADNNRSPRQRSEF